MSETAWKWVMCLELAALTACAFVVMAQKTIGARPATGKVTVNQPNRAVAEQSHPKAKPELVPLTGTGSHTRIWPSTEVLQAKPYTVVIGENIITISPTTGKVTIAKGVTLDEASKAFWQAVEKQLHKGEVPCLGVVPRKIVPCNWVDDPVGDTAHHIKKAPKPEWRFS